MMRIFARFLSNNISKPLKITYRCVDKLKTTLNTGEYFRIAVEPGGCSGFQYKFDITESIGEDDCVFYENDIKFVVDKLSLDLIRGSTLDYKEEIIRSNFLIQDNPNASSKCGCGTSFDAS